MKLYFINVKYAKKNDFPTLLYIVGMFFFTNFAPQNDKFIE